MRGRPRKTWSEEIRIGAATRDLKWEQIKQVTQDTMMEGGLEKTQRETSQPYTCRSRRALGLRHKH